MAQTVKDDTLNTYYDGELKVTIIAVEEFGTTFVRGDGMNLLGFAINAYYKMSDEWVGDSSSITFKWVLKSFDSKKCVLTVMITGRIR